MIIYWIWNKNGEIFIETSNEFIARVALDNNYEVTSVSVS